MVCYQIIFEVGPQYNILWCINYNGMKKVHTCDLFCSMGARVLLAVFKKVYEWSIGFDGLISLHRDFIVMLCINTLPKFFIIF